MIGAAIPSFATALAVRRTEESTTFVDGIAQVVTDVDTFCIYNCCVQPVLGREREVLPELIRDREVIKVYTECLLRSVDIEGKRLADRLVFQDQDYVVQTVEDWHLHGSYWKVLAVKEND